MTDVPRDHPDAAGLLAVAREACAREIQPFLKDDLRLAGLMIASAMAMAEREIRRPAAGILEAWPLVHAMRAGRHDGDRALHATLLEDARERLAIANPRYLSDRE